MTETVLITGANGGLGRLIRPRLARPGRTLRLLDLVTPDAPADGEDVEVLEGSVTDDKAMRDACAGVDAVIHLGGISVEAPWQDILTNNIDGTRVLLEEARDAGVDRVVLASSNHAVGFYDKEEAGRDGLPADVLPRPDTYYGFSKAALEALGSLFHFRYGMDVTCLRIGSCFKKPWDPRSLWTWMSLDDGLGCSRHASPRLSRGSGSCGASPATPEGGGRWRPVSRSAITPRTTLRCSRKRSSPGSTSQP